MCLYKKLFSKTDKQNNSVRGISCNFSRDFCILRKYSYCHSNDFIFFYLVHLNDTMDKEVLTCYYCKSVYWDPVIVGCCQSPFCYCCLQEQEEKDEKTHCPYCTKEWQFTNNSLEDVTLSNNNVVTVDIQKLEVLSFLLVIINVLPDQ